MVVLAALACQCVLGTFRGGGGSSVLLILLGKKKNVTWTTHTAKRVLLSW